MAISSPVGCNVQMRVRERKGRAMEHLGGVLASIEHEKSLQLFTQSSGLGGDATVEQSACSNGKIKYKGPLSVGLSNLR